MVRRASARANKTPVDAHRRDGSPEPAYAAIDLGTNSCRMLVAHPCQSGFTVVDGFSRIVRLGERVTETGRLSEPAISRTIGALKQCAHRLSRRRVGALRAVATEACRKADNADYFLSRVEDETGIELEVISPTEEAALTVAGCGELLASGRDHALVFDIGGGSTEISWLETPLDGCAKLLATVSLPFGVVSLRDEFGPESLPVDVYDQLLARIDAHLKPFDTAHGIAEKIGSGTVRMIGTSGTVTTLGAMSLELPRYNRNRVDGLEIKFDRLRYHADKLERMSSAERIAHPCLGHGRGDLMLMGLAILRAVCDRWPAGNLRIADRGIREGVLSELMAADGFTSCGPMLDRTPIGAELAMSKRKTTKSGSGSRGLHTRVKTAKGRKLSSTRWLQRQLNDPFVQEAKRLGYRSRAAFKLSFLDDKYKLLKPGSRLIDLGAAPGGWSQVAVERIGPSGRVLGIDLLEIEPLAGADFIIGDFLDDDAPDRLKTMAGGPVDLVLSDMAAAATGHKHTDHLRIIALLEVAVEFAREVLKPGGGFVGKVLQGGTEGELLQNLKQDFETVRHAKPPASRSDSTEMYVVATGFRGRNL